MKEDIKNVLKDYSQKGKDDLGRDIAYIKNEHFDSVVKDIIEAVMNDIDYQAYIIKTDLMNNIKGVLDEHYRKVKKTVKKGINKK